VQRQRAAGAEFFQTPEDGWLSVAAWYKLTNRVIPGCGKDLFDEPFSEQTRCIFSRPNDRSEAFNIVSRCLGATPSTTRKIDGSCSGSPCIDASHCRSKFGFCGSSGDHCNSESTWKVGGCGEASITTTSRNTPVTTAMETTTIATFTASMTHRHVSTETTTVTTIATSTTSRLDNTCSGSPCGDATHCRSKWGWCGSGVQYCNTKSTWTATGCGVDRLTSTSTSPTPSTTLSRTSTITSSVSTTTSTVSFADSCQGAPCLDPSMCRSKWGWCGSSSAYCNMESTWKADGCNAMQFAALSLNATGANSTLAQSGSLSFACRTSDSIDGSLIIALVVALACCSLAK